jgi:hypothetical protein
LGFFAKDLDHRQRELLFGIVDRRSARDVAKNV